MAPFKPAAVHLEHCCAENNLKGFFIFIFTTLISYCVLTDSIFVFGTFLNLLNKDTRSVVWGRSAGEKKGGKEIKTFA